MLFGLSNEITAHSNRVTLIDVASGRFLPKPSHHTPVYEYHQMDDVSLPDWDVALRWVIKAHNACSNFVFVGWDVSFTPNGPVILEGNANWGPDTNQTLRRQALGFSKFADVLETHLHKLSNSPPYSSSHTDSQS
jgi:hypothetical protein